MRYQGRIADWNDDKGFGFVTPNGGGARAFVHIKAFVNARRRPLNGDLITYEASADQMGRIRANKIQFYGDALSQPKENTRSPQRMGFAIFYALAFCIGLGTLVAIGKLSMLAPFVYAIASLVTILIYVFDKAAALNNRWRTRESTLLVLGLACGWPGAVAAQKLFRHKSKKFEFQTAFWLTVFLNTAALVWCITPSGELFLSAFTPTR